MAKTLDELKDIFLGKKKEKENKSAVEISELLSEEIVKRVLEKYEEEGTYVPAEEKEAESLKDILTVRTITSKVAVSLDSYPSPVVRTLGKLYEKMKNFVDRIAERLVNTKVMRDLDFELYAANIPLTAGQYVSLVITASIIISLLSLLFAPFLIVRLGLVGIVSAPLLAFIVFFLIFSAGMTYPLRMARMRGQRMEKELPFALRHLAVVIRSGMSLYQAMESIASAEYGILSEEFRRTLREISEGKTTEEALESLALRSHSRAMRRTVSQIIRALRIGGNLSDAIKRIAEDLTFEQVMKIREFSEKLNLVGVVFMFVGVVFPTLLAMLNGIGHAPIGINILAGFALPINVLAALYLVVIPLFMVVILLFVKFADPLGE